MSDNRIEVNGKVALVTGSNRGIGRAILEELLERGAAKVYAGTRKPEALEDLQAKYGERLVPVQLDVTNQADIDAAGRLAKDVDILINNAGVGAFGGFFGENTNETLDLNLSVNVHGLVNVSRALVDALRKQEESAIVNISSVAGLGSMPSIGTYSATKAAVHSITQGFRAELAPDGVQVYGVYPGPIDTDMAKDFPMDKETPQNTAKAILDGLKNGTEDIYPDPMSQQVGEGYNASPKGVEKQFAEFV